MSESLLFAIACGVLFWENQRAKRATNRRTVSLDDSIEDLRIRVDMMEEKAKLNEMRYNEWMQTVQSEAQKSNQK